MIYLSEKKHSFIKSGGRHGRDSMVVGFTTTYAISAITSNIVHSNPAQAMCT